MGSAGDSGARIRALLDSVVGQDAEVARFALGAVATGDVDGGLARLAALDEVRRVARVAVDAETRGDVVLRDAKRVGAALELATAVDALARATAELEADLLRLAVEIVGAVSPRLAALA